MFDKLLKFNNTKSFYAGAFYGYFVLQRAPIGHHYVITPDTASIVIESRL